MEQIRRPLACLPLARSFVLAPATQATDSLALFRAVGELCNPYFGTVCVARRCKFFLFIEFKIQITWPGIPYPESKLSGALWRPGEKRKESLQLRLGNLNICIEKIDAKC